MPPTMLKPSDLCPGPLWKTTVIRDMDSDRGRGSRGNCTCLGGGRGAWSKCTENFRMPVIRGFSSSMISGNDDCLEYCCCCCWGDGDGSAPVSSFLAAHLGTAGGFSTNTTGTGAACSTSTADGRLARHTTVNSTLCLDERNSVSTSCRLKPFTLVPFTFTTSS